MEAVTFAMVVQTGDCVINLEAACSALPARNWNSGSFYAVTENANFWTATQSSSTNAWNRNVNYANAGVNRNNNNKANNARSVRCVRDKLKSVVQGSGIRVQGLGFRVQGSGIRQPHPSPLINSSTHQLINSSTHQLINSSTHQLIYSSTHLLIYLSTYLLIYLSTYLLPLTPKPSSTNPQQAYCRSVFWGFLKKINFIFF